MKQPKLLESYEQLLGGWRDTFTQVRVWERVRRLSLGMLVSLRLHLTSTAICATGRQFQDWTADYRVCSQSPWNARELFDPILDALPELLSGADAPVLAALDDTMVKKTGRKIPGVAIGRDPMSPPFHVNLCYGLRFVQVSLLVAPRQGEGAARALPVRFEFAPPAVKPKSKSRKSAGDPSTGGKTVSDGEAAAEPTVESPANSDKGSGKKKKAKPPETPEEAAYKQEKKLRRLPQVGVEYHPQPT